MRRFRLRELDFELPEAALRGGIEQALTSGRYEGSEADALLAHLQPGDRFVDLGAGMGFLCCLAARLLGAGQVTGVEAGPGTLALARSNLALNGFGEVQLIHGAVVGTPPPEGHVAFGLRPAFWASALKGEGDWPGNARPETVPALAAGPLLSALAPDVLSCDIEGGELAVLTGELPESLRLIVAELHPSVYGRAGSRQIFDALSARGFAYEPVGSRGATVVFARI